MKKSGGIYSQWRKAGNYFPLKVCLHDERIMQYREKNIMSCTTHCATIWCNIAYDALSPMETKIHGMTWNLFIAQIYSKGSKLTLLPKVLILGYMSFSTCVAFPTCCWFLSCGFLSCLCGLPFHTCRLSLRLCELSPRACKYFHGS